MPSKRPTVTDSVLTTGPPAPGPTLAEAIAAAKRDHGPASVGPHVDANTAFTQLGWVMGHGLPHSLRRARTAAAAIRAGGK